MLDGRRMSAGSSAIDSQNDSLLSNGPRDGSPPRRFYDGDHGDVGWDVRDENPSLADRVTNARYKPPPPRPADAHNYRPRPPPKEEWL